jgi:glycosyltransferase involved in cell wall biosynthesis
MDTSIVIPAYNEQENLPKLLSDLLSLKKSLGKFEIIISDDNSSDNTSAIADSFAKKFKNIRVIHRKKGINGMGAALKDGSRLAKGRYIVWVMGDSSDSLKTIPIFIKKLASGYDMVFGSRYTPGGSSGDLEPSKAVLSYGYTFISRLLFDFKVHDITNAFRAFKKQVYYDIRPKSNDFAISPEFAIKAQLRHYKLGESPATYKKRRAGKANFRMLKMGLSYIKLFKYRFIKF